MSHAIQIKIILFLDVLVNFYARYIDSAPLASHSIYLSSLSWQFETNNKLQHHLRVAAAVAVVAAVVAAVVDVAVSIFFSLLKKLSRFR